MWATKIIEQLLEGKEVKFKPQGNSMTPIIFSGQLVTVSPVTENDAIKPGDVVLCKVNGYQYLHLVSAIGSDGRFQISNNHGHINGYAARKNIFGLLTKVEQLMTEREMFEKSFERPRNFFDLSEEQQFKIDKKLGLLGWVGTGLKAKDLVRFNRHYFPEDDHIWKGKLHGKF